MSELFVPEASEGKVWKILKCQTGDKVPNNSILLSEVRGESGNELAFYFIAPTEEKS